MPALIGLILALSVALMARVVGFDRDRAFYPVVLMVVASYYILFAVIGGSPGELQAELLVFLPFAGLAIARFRTNLWLVVGGLAAHGVFDFFRHQLLPGRGVPQWWPDFCLGYDVPAAACLALLLIVRHGPPARATPARET